MASPSPPTLVEQPSPNHIAVVAAVLAAVVLGLLVGLTMVTSAHQSEILAFSQEIDKLRGDGMGLFAAQQKAMLQITGSQAGAPPAWMIEMTLLYAGTALAWLATMICALVGLRRKRRQKLALAAFLLGTVVPVFFCCGGGLGLSGGAG